MRWSESTKTILASEQCCLAMLSYIKHAIFGLRGLAGVLEMPCGCLGGLGLGDLYHEGKGAIMPITYHIPAMTCCGSVQRRRDR